MRITSEASGAGAGRERGGSGAGAGRERKRERNAIGVRTEVGREKTIPLPPRSRYGNFMAGLGLSVYAYE